MTDYSLTPEAEILICTELQKAFPNALGIYAFGSRIQGTANAQSDLDLAVLVAGYADPLQLFEVTNQLADKLGYEVDLFDLRAASTVMQYQVITTGRRLWAKDVQADLFDVFVLNETMKRMMGFRNIAVHDYQTLLLPIVENIIKNHLDDFFGFSKQLLQKSKM